MLKIDDIVLYEREEIIPIFRRPNIKVDKASVLESSPE
jgi:hypothetical protein